jgi:TonB family protein
MQSLFLLETALKSIVILAVAWCVLGLLRGKSAAVRHFIWSVTFAGMLSLPILSITLPALSVPVAREFIAPDFVFETSAHQPRNPHDYQGRTFLAPLLNTSAVLPDWRLLVMLVWAAGTVISFAQMLVGWACVHRFRRQSRDFTEVSFPKLAKLMKVEHSVQLLQTESETMPMTYGVFRPTIFLPSDARRWSEERRQMVILHELAHVRRGDGTTHLMARTALSLYWWNPLAWSAWREFLKERERAADDLVLSVGAGRPEYAGHLLEIARSLQSPPLQRWPVIAMASHSQLEGRLSSILDSGRDRKTPRRASIVCGAFAALAVIVPLAAVQGQTGAAKAEVALKNLGQETQTAIDALNSVQAGDQAREQGKLAQAKALYTKALTTEPNQPIALIHRGTVDLESKDFPSAMDDFEQAQKADSGYAAEALMWQAITQERDNQPDAAEQLYQRALAATDMHSLAAATTMDLYSHLLQQQGKYDQATLMQTQASAIRNAQPEPHSTSTARHVGKDVSSPVLKSKLEPEYSAEARTAKFEGTVLLRTEIGTDGLVHDIHVIRPLGLGLDEKAVAAVTKWKFQPGMVDGQPVAVVANIEVKFRLQ